MKKFLISLLILLFAGTVFAAAPTIDENGTIYVGDNSAGYGKLYSISPDGTINWNLHTYGEMLSSPVIGQVGTIFAGDRNNYINAFNPNGTFKWSYKTGHKVYSSPAIGDDGTVYCGSHDGNLYALYPNNGTLKWKYKTGDWVARGPSIADDGTIYFGSWDGYLYAVYPNGTLKWKTGGYLAGTTPVTGSDGTIYVGNQKLTAIYPEYPRRISAQDLGLGGFADGKLQDGGNILLDIDDPGPIRTKDDLIGIPFQVGEVLEEVLGRKTGYIHIHVLMQTGQKEGPVVPETPASMGLDDLQFGEEDGYLV